MTVKHILFVPSWYPTERSPTGGIFFQDQARSLLDAGYTVGVVAVEILRWRGPRPMRNPFHIGGVVDRLEAGVRVVRSQQLNVVPRRWRATRWVREMVRLADLYRAAHGEPDVIHAQSTLWGGYAAHVVARRWRRPLVITEHSTAFLRGSIGEWERRWVRSACATPTRVLAVGPALARALSDITGDEMPTIVPNLVDTEFFRPPPTPAINPVDLLCVAMLEKKKGIDVLLRSLARLRGAGLALRLQVIGDGAERGSLEDLTERLGLGDSVTFSGLGSRGQVREALWNTRAFVLPSRVETFGLVLAEAIACGVPVVATVCGGPESFVRPPFGQVVPPDDVPALAAAVVNVLSGIVPQSSQRAREYAVSGFGPKAFHARLGRIYREVRSS